MSKSLLKAAREALDSQNYSTAIELCTSILENEPEQYHALVFKGLAHLKSNAVQEGVLSFEKAIALQPSNVLAFQVGFCGILYEKRDSFNAFRPFRTTPG